MATTEPIQDLLDIAAVAERLKVRERYIRRLVDERRIPYIKLGHFIRFDPDEIARWVDESRVHTNPDVRMR